MSVTGLATGLSGVGKYILSRKGQQRETKNRFTLEMLRNEMWKRRLREQAVQQERQRQMLIEREKERTKQTLIEQQRMYAEHQDEMALRKKEYDLKEKELGLKEHGEGYYKKTRPVTGKYITAKEREISRILKKKDTGAPLTEQEQNWLKNYFMGKETFDWQSLFQEESDPLGIR